MGDGIKTAMAIQNFLEEIGDEPPRPFPLMQDNQSAIILAKTSIFAKGLRHLNLKYHFINDEVEKGTVSITYVESKAQLADIFTKALDRVEHQRQTKLLLSEIPRADYE